jgi:hypothetical protein
MRAFFCLVDCRVCHSSLCFLVSGSYSKKKIFVICYDPSKKIWPVSSNFLYHSLIVLSVGGSVWYLVRKPRCTVIIDSILASCKTQKDFCSPENAMFPHYCLLVEKRVTKPWHKTQEENSIIYSFHWHALIPCGWVFLWATDLRNPGGNYETHCILWYWKRTQWKASLNTAMKLRVP